MIKKFRFTVELKAQVHDSPRGVGHGETIERVRRLAQKIAADETALIEVYKTIFLDLLLGDSYSEEIRNAIKIRTEEELILPSARDLNPQDSEFFARLFPEDENEDLKVDKDNILNLFYSQFGNPKIAEVRLECLECNTEVENI